MSKWRCVSVVLAVICLSVMLSLETDAQSTVDETTSSCGSSTSDEVLSIVKMMSSNLRENTNEIKDVKRLIGENQNSCHAAGGSNQAISAQSLMCKYRPISFVYLFPFHHICRKVIG